MRDVGVYIHYPWCRKLCPYCDFAVAIAPVDEIPHQSYLDAVLAELSEGAAAFAGRQLVSIYFGGGTPSLWPVRCLEQAIREARAAFGADGELEVTIEANPTDCTPEVMASWRAAGINRLSIGVQSFGAEALVKLGRDHRVGDGATAIEAAVAAGFASVSADVILGVPGAASQTDARSAVRIAETGVQHVSVYELTIEDRTKFGALARRGELVPLDDDELADIYTATHEQLGALGFEHYEVSSYARPGHRAIHNSLYWRGAEYLGLGCGAASYRVRDDGGAVRWTNLRSAKQFLGASGDDRVAETVELSAEEVLVDQLWLGLRTVDGVAETALADRPETLDGLVAADLVTLVSGRIRPTMRGFLFHNQVANRIVGNLRYTAN